MQIDPCAHVSDIEYNRLLSSGFYFSWFMVWQRCGRLSISTTERTYARTTMRELYWSCRFFYDTTWISSKWGGSLKTLHLFETSFTHTQTRWFVATNRNHITYANTVKPGKRLSVTALIFKWHFISRAI